MAGTFTKKFTKGRGIKKWHRWGLIYTPKDFYFNNDPTPS